MELIEEFERMAKSDTVRRRNIRTKLSYTLGILGWLIIGYALNNIIFTSLPLGLASLEWQLNFFSSFISSSFNILTGSTLIIVAQLFNTKQRSLLKWQAFVSNLAAWLAIVLLLIIPLQIFLGLRALNEQKLPTVNAINNLRGTISRINTISTEPELRAYLASIPNPPTLAYKPDAAFPASKQQAIDYIKADINVKTNAADSKNSQAVQTFMKEAVKNASQAILMATAFSVLANLSNSANNFVTRFLCSFV